jgi:hypothetical protein
VREASAAMQLRRIEEPVPRLRRGPFDLRGLYHPSARRIFDRGCAKISEILNLG